MSLLRVVGRHGWWVAGIGLVAVAGVLLLRHQAPGDYGWFAYTPLSDDRAFGTGPIVLTREREVAYGLGILGALVLTGGLCYRLGQRRVRA